MSYLFDSLKNFVELKVKTELEICKLKSRLLKKNADYSKIFLMFADNLHKVERATFVARAVSVPLSAPEANIFFNFFAEYDEEARLHSDVVFYSAFLRKLAPNDVVDA